MAQNINYDIKISNYDEAVKEIAKALDFLPEDEKTRTNYVNAVAGRLLRL